MADIQRLLEIMAQLRNPVSGCPWDLEQTFESISPFTIEEAYEVDEAIASGDREALCDELGDLLFQVVFQARIGEELGHFDFGSVVEAISSKLVRRHPHVFADAETPGSIEGQLASWEDIKAAEREAAGQAQDRAVDPFDGIPRHLPALARSLKITRRAERLASERTRAEGPTSREGLQSALERAGVAVGRAAEDRAEGQAERVVGEGLASWVAIARALGVDPEQALRQMDDERMDDVRARAANPT